MQSHSPYSESTPLSGDGAAGFNRWVDGIVKQTNGKGRIRVHIPGKTDGMAIDLLPWARPVVLRPNGGSTKNVASLYPPEKEQLVQVFMIDESNVIWQHYPLTKDTIPPCCDYVGEYGKIVYASEKGVLVFVNEQTGDIYVRSPQGSIMHKFAGGFHVYSGAERISCLKAAARWTFAAAASYTPKAVLLSTAGYQWFRTPRCQFHRSVWVRVMQLPESDRKTTLAPPLPGCLWHD